MAGMTSYCMGVTSRGDYTGAKYFFVGRKRGEGGAGEEEDGNCTSVRPDTLVLADGVTKYNIVDLDDAKVEELVSTLFVFVLAPVCWMEPLTNWSPRSRLLLLILVLDPKGCLRSFRRSASRVGAKDSLDAKFELLSWHS